ncbi:FecCD family ABC transporter permease [Zavarzinia sp. CC-PAN008]|uniref:FecCD family ABC transporter permease n=1 Tax=Zavarzinia sp. CC-PAN008 TaxID=3243332 RepID=UPI003F748252
MAVADQAQDRIAVRQSARIALIPGLILTILVLAACSLALGAARIPPVELLHQVLAGDAIAQAIVLDIRSPRLILSLAVGATLGAAGAALQGLLRNPLAEPSVLGASNAAALGAVIVLYFGLSASMPLALPLGGVAGALLALGVLVAVAGRSESPLTLILAGLALSTLAGAGISLALNLSPNPFAAMEIAFWLLGSLEDRSMSHVQIALPLMVCAILLLLWDRRALDALTLGEDSAKALGVDLARVRIRMVAGVGLGVGAAVAVTGAIGFVGLVVPHLVRPLTDYRPSRAILPSALAGAALLTAADIVVRLIPASNELKLGVVTAFLGVPFFLVLLFRARRIW